MPLLATPVLYLLPGNKRLRQVGARKLIHIVFKAYIHMMRAMGILTWDVQGLEKLQRPGILVLANHPTLLDVVFLVAFVPNANCIVKSRLMQNPAMKGFVTITGYITNDNGETLVEKACCSMDSGSALIIFPEGTRTTPGSELSFQRGAANIIVRGKVKPTPVVINCQPETLSKHQKWYHIPDRKFHLSFCVLDDMEVEKYMEMNASVAARQLTRYLEDTYTQEVMLDERRSI
ncbi:MAG: 1-acyl-sn-glycerol-3-phosphate acyltransferase [Porticoccus sp.]|nr:1-acyl-sn-glycerol-3-phosphate acyltransferase [Porticoccus sp.]